MIMTIDARHVQRHQMQVVDCLRSPDDTLKRKVSYKSFLWLRSSRISCGIDSMAMSPIYRRSICCTR
jgi:hypothetical protein